MTNRLYNNGLSYKAKIVLIACPLALSVFMAFAFLGDGDVGNHEAFVAVTAREMLNSGNWTVPIYNGQPRLNKTPLCYWLVGFAGKISGQISAFVLRLPSALLAVISAAAILFFVNKWLGLRIAALAVLFWSTSLGFIRYSHTGRPEMALCSFVTIAMLSFYAWTATEARREQIRYMIIFWISFSLAMLAKGPAPILLTVPAIFFYFAVFRKWKKIPKALPIIGTLLFLIIVLPWPIMVALKEPGALNIWKTEFIGRATGHSTTGKPIYYYLGVMFIFFIPWAAFLPLALTSPFFRVWGKKQNTMLYLWLWFVVDIIAMSLCSGKREHYILPAMPALAILTAIIFEDMLFCAKAYTRKFSRNFFLGHLIAALVLVAAGAGWALKTGGVSVLPVTIFSSLAVIMLLIIAFLLRGGLKTAACVCIFATITIVLMVGLMKTVSEHNENYLCRVFSEKVAEKIGENEQLIAYCKIKSGFVYYFGRDVTEISELDKVYDFYARGGWVLAIDEYLEKLKSEGRFKIAILRSDGERAVFNKNADN